MTYHPPNAAAAANYKSRALKRQRSGLPLTSDQTEFLARNPGRSRPQAPPPPQQRVEPARERAPEPVHRPVEVSAPPEPVKAAAPDMTVIDFGSPGESMVPVQPKGCAIVGCTHTPREHGPQRCGITGEKYYPPFKMNAAKGVARGTYFCIGFVIAAFRGLDEVPDPTDSEVQDGADAVVDIVATRAPELAVYSDLLAGGFSIMAYSNRTMNMPKGKP